MQMLRVQEMQHAETIRQFFDIKHRNNILTPSAEDELKELFAQIEQEAAKHKMRRKKCDIQEKVGEEYDFSKYILGYTIGASINA
jgi:uncharacterized membrane protein